MNLTLYGITDSKWTGDRTLEEQVEAAIKGGVTVIQYREKYKTKEEKRIQAEAILKICRSYNVPLIINDDVELAAGIDADGVHLGQDDMNPVKAREILGADKIVGVTARSVSQAMEAEKAGADYLGSGAVFGTTTKGDAKPMDHNVLDEICSSVSIPVVAIGGIGINNIEQLRGRKMSGFAVVSGIFGNDDILEATKRLKAVAEEILKR